MIEWPHLTSCEKYAKFAAGKFHKNSIAAGGNVTDKEKNTDVFVMPKATRGEGTARYRTYINLHEFLSDMMEKEVPEAVLVDVVTRLLKQSSRYATRRSEATLRDALKKMLEAVKSGSEPKSFEQFFPRAGKSKDLRFIFNMNLKPLEAFSEIIKELTATPPMADVEQTMVTRPSSDQSMSDGAITAPIINSEAEAEDTDPGLHVARLVGEPGGLVVASGDGGSYQRVREAPSENQPESKIIRATKSTNGESRTEVTQEIARVTKSGDSLPLAREGAQVFVLTPEQQALLRQTDGEAGRGEADKKLAPEAVKPPKDSISASLPPGEPVMDTPLSRSQESILRAASELRSRESERLRLAAAWRQYRDRPEMLLTGMAGTKDLFDATHGFLFKGRRLSLADKELGNKLRRLCGLDKCELSAREISDAASELLVTLKADLAEKSAAARAPERNPELKSELKPEPVLSPKEEPRVEPKELAAVQNSASTQPLVRIPTPTSNSHYVERNEVDLKLDKWLMVPAGRDKILSQIFDLAFEINHFEACIRILVAEPGLRSERASRLFERLNGRYVREPERIKNLLREFLPLPGWRVDAQTHCTDLALELDRHDEVFLFGCLCERGGVSKMMSEERIKALAVGRAITAAREPAEALENALARLAAAMKTDIVFQSWTYAEVGGFFSNLGRGIRKFFHSLLR